MEPTDNFYGMIGRSGPMLETFERIEQVAATDLPVLITGESGTGKDLAAHAVHRLSRRREGPYLAFHIGSVAPELMSSALFGHEQGAFTGAVDSRAGRFEETHKGTLFLDEIGTMDEKVQISLLRVLEQQSFRRVGGRRDIHVDVRIICATNQDVRELVAQTLFREDLYFRLDVFPITLPPLRERAGDLDLLVQSFCEEYSAELGKTVRVPADTMSLLRRYPWPGNVRELRNVLQQCSVTSDTGVLIPDLLPEFIRTGPANTDTVEIPIGASLRDVEIVLIEKTLEQVGRNKKKAAEVLGISRRALYNKIERYNIV